VDQAVTCSPDISERARDHKNDSFLIVACDGIWDCKTNEECVKFLKDNLTADVKTNNLCPPLEKLLEDCCALNTDDGIGTDNMTAVLIKFKS